MKNRVTPIITDRIVSDITFATRFRSFLNDIQVNDAMSFEELEYLRNVADELLNYQIATVSDQQEVQYLIQCHPERVAK